MHSQRHGAAQCCALPGMTWRCFRLAPVQCEGGRCSSVLMMPFNLHSRAAVICRIQCVCSRRSEACGRQGSLLSCREGVQRGGSFQA